MTTSSLEFSNKSAVDRWTRMEIPRIETTFEIESK